MLTAIGGSLMTLGALIFFVVLVGTLLAGRRGMGPAGVPIAETLTEPARIGWEVRLDRLGLWIGVVILLILCLPAVRDRVPATPSRLAGVPAVLIAAVPSFGPSDRCTAASR